mgnify:CR=1 FL=1
MKRVLRSVIVATSLVSLIGHSALAQQPVQQGADLSTVQVGVALTPATDRLMGPGGGAVVRAFESALARNGMGAFVQNAPTRFVLAVSIEPLYEDVTPTSPPLVIIRARVSGVFGDSKTRRTVAEFSREQRATGRTRELAVRAIGNALRLDDGEFREAAAEASRRIIGFFEQQCDAVILEATTMAGQQRFDEAILQLEGVPREARACHARAQQAAADAFVAMQREACSVTFAQAQARWVAGPAREVAREVADSIGTIPSGSPCFADAGALLEDVATALAAVDSAAAEREREEFAQKKKEYDDQLGLIRQRMQDDTSLRTLALQNEYLVRSAAAEGARQVGLDRALALAASYGSVPKVESFSPIPR